MIHPTMPAEEHRYRIVVRGRLDGIHRAAVEGFENEPDGPDTTLVATVDQATLHRSLDRLHSARLEIVSIQRLPGDRG